MSKLTTNYKTINISYRTFGVPDSFTDLELAAIKTFLNASTASQLRLTLQLAFMVSPLYLLVPYSLHKIKSWTRESLYKVIFFSWFVFDQN